MPKKKSLPLRIGLIGCGNVSNAYFEHSKSFSDAIQIGACASRTVAHAEAKSVEHGLSKAYPVKELMEDSEIDVVLNLTNPGAHTEINLQALRAGKHAGLPGWHEIEAMIFASRTSQRNSNLHRKNPL